MIGQILSTRFSQQYCIFGVGKDLTHTLPLHPRIFLQVDKRRPATVDSARLTLDP